MVSTRQIRDIAFIVNPKSGTSSPTAVGGQIERYLDQSRFNYTLHHTQYPDHAYELSRDAVLGGVAVVVAVGGDGTMNECARALVNSDTILGLIPMGSGNGLARDLGIPREIRKSINLINHYHYRSIDCGTINGSYFFCTAGVGFDALVSKRFEQQDIRGFAGYLKTAFNEFSTYESCTYQIEFDHTHKQVKAFSVTLANAGQFGNDAYISPYADPGDGLIDLCIVKEFPKFNAVAMVLNLFSRSMHKNRYTEIHPLKRATIKCPKGAPYHLDGEIKTVQEGILEIEVVPQALKIMAP